MNHVSRRLDACSIHVPGQELTVVQELVLVAETDGLLWVSGMLRPLGVIVGSGECLRGWAMDGKPLDAATLVAWQALRR